MNRKTGLAPAIVALVTLSATAGLAQANTAGAAQAASHADASEPANSPVAPDAEGKAIFEINCSGCHELSDATSQAKDLAGWTATIQKMVDYGAPVAVEDQQRIAAYLAATYPAPSQ
jgi:cytochrome c5